MNSSTLQIDPQDNVIVALKQIPSGEIVVVNGGPLTVIEDIPAKHKVAIENIEEGEIVRMYGVVVGRAIRPISLGSRVSTENLVHDTSSHGSSPQVSWSPPDLSKFSGQTFMGYHRADGSVGTMNYWLVIPLVFCENRNIEVIKASMLHQLGYSSNRDFTVRTDILIDAFRKGLDKEDILQLNIHENKASRENNRVFKNVDGIKFLTHEGGCGFSPQDNKLLCRLLAGYIAHPNVAGATILSLGCQISQVRDLQEELALRGANKPLYILEQQKSRSEREFIANSVKKTFVGLIEANKDGRSPAPLSKLRIGLECGGSDGFSGITANPTLGWLSDMVVGLGGTTLLAEFPELHGVEHELISRCVTSELADRFSHLMTEYNDKAKAGGSGFENNPSPGNIRDGLITDAMKSAGAAKKGGKSPVMGVLDYGEAANEPGLHLLCTPGNDVESTTGLAGAGSTIILFTTGLGTPTGNPVAPVIKVATNDQVAESMSDIIDFNTGGIISRSESLEYNAHRLLEYVIQVASGELTPAAVRLGQDDFIPWKRGISL